MYYGGKRFKSWPGLKKQLEERLCDGLRGHVTYYLTYYRDVHDSYGRAAVRLDSEELKSRWNAEGVFCERDFLSAALRYLDLPIADALQSDDPLVRLFAILDRRAGSRTLQRISDSGEYLSYPDWLRQFYLLRLEIPQK